MSADLLREIAERHAEWTTPETLTAAICGDLRLNARQREALFGLVLERCQQWERSRVREVGRMSALLLALDLLTRDPEAQAQ